MLARSPLVARPQDPARVLGWRMPPLPQVRVAGWFRHSDRDYVPVYSSRTHALHLYDYDCTVRFGRRSFAIAAGDLTLSPAGRATSYDVPTPGKHLCVHFDAEPRRSDKGALGAAVRLPFHVRLGPHREYVEQRLDTIVRLHATAERDAFAAATASTELLSLMLWLARVGARLPVTRPRAHAPPLRAEHAVEAAADWIEQHLDSPLSVPELARSVGLSQNYLASRFRARFGVRLPSYALERRIASARYLLATTTLPIKEIAVRVGLPDPHHFNKQFRRLVGESPTDFRLTTRE